MEDLTSIPQYSSWREVSPILKGWSNDRKYRVVDRDGQSFLLRTSDSKNSKRKIEEFLATSEFSRTGVNMSIPIDYGYFEKGRRFYSLLTWVEGIEASDYLKIVSQEEQYELGLLAGKALRELHSLPAPGNQKDWDSRFNKKIDAKITKYLDCPIKFRADGKLIEFILENRLLLKTREQTYQHGDFHIGNLIVTAGNRIGIIDFNRFDFGDPWEEFNRITFCSSLSASFASGRINGYFNSQIPEDFFRLLALYISVNTLSAIPWAIPFGETEIQVMLKQAEAVLDFYEDFSTIIPKWYERDWIEKKAL